MADEIEVSRLISRFEQAVVMHERSKQKQSFRAQLRDSDSDREYDAAKLAITKALRRS